MANVVRVQMQCLKSDRIRMRIDSPHEYCESEVPFAANESFLSSLLEALHGVTDHQAAHQKVNWRDDTDTAMVMDLQPTGTDFLRLEVHSFEGAEPKGCGVEEFAYEGPLKDSVHAFWRALRGVQEQLAEFGASAGKPVTFPDERLDALTEKVKVWKFVM
jgi:hypothetical protein